MDRALEMICDRLYDEIEEVGRAEKLSPSSIEMLDKAVDILKDLKEMEHMDSGYSGRYAYEGGGTSSRRGRYSRNSEAVSKLEDMYNNAGSDKEREIIRKVMNQI